MNQRDSDLGSGLDKPRGLGQAASALRDSVSSSVRWGCSAQSLRRPLPSETAHVGLVLGKVIRDPQSTYQRTKVG